MTTNCINGKIYIGRHKSAKYDKWYLGSGKRLLEAIEKYGEENFSNKVLHYCDSEEELNRLEKLEIAERNARDPDIGYNIDVGGTNGNWLENRDPESAAEYRRHMSELSRTGVCGNKGRQFSEEHRRRIGEGNRGKVRTPEQCAELSRRMKGRPAWNRGLTIDDERVQKYARKKGEYTHSDEVRAKMSEKARNRDNATFSRAVIGKIWISNGEQSKMIYPQFFDEYAKQGYVKGRGGCFHYGKSGSKI